MQRYTYGAEEIFGDLDSDEENVAMKIPDEIALMMGWKPGDTLKIEVLESGGISITKVENGEK